MRWVLVSVLITTSVARAAIVTAASCQRADVGSAVLLASAGDEVRIPAGTCTWLTQLTIDKPLTLRGAGQGVTTIRDGVVKNGMGDSHLLVFVDASGLRLTALTIEGLEPDPSVWNFGHVSISGETRNFRIDHVTFTSMQTSGIRVSGRGIGVIDHCAFDGDFKQGVIVDHDTWDGGSWGDVSWATPSSLGTAENVFVEDCTFANVAQTAPGAVAALGGARVVVRHNVFSDQLIYASGTDSSGRYRSSRHLEVSNNRFQTTKYLEPAVVVNGGTAVVFDNLVDPLYGATVGVEVIRARSSFQLWGRCNGTNAWDENAQPSGAACLDGVGRGMGLLISGDMPTAMWPQQEREPVYAWNNTYDGGATYDDGSPSVLVAGVDYIEGARPGFVPFQYPHPLVVSEVVLEDGGIVPSVDGGAPRRYWQIVSGCSSAPSLCIVLALVALRRRR